MHIAIVSFGYPPLRHVSATRPSYFAELLSRRGHRVTVVTVDWQQPSDPAKRPPEPGAPEVLAIDPRAWFPGFDPARRPLSTEPTGPEVPILRRFETLRRTLRWGPFPSWARAGLAALLARHRRYAVDVVWAIHGDDSSHEIAYRFGRCTGVPWVADFKDPWDLYHRPGLPVLVQRLATERRLRKASALTETCKAQADSDAVRFRLPAHVIWSGYDTDLMAAAAPERISPRFTLAYTGGFSAQHDIGAIARLLEAWRALPEPPAELELHLFNDDASPLRRRLEARGVAGYLREHAFVPRGRAYAVMKGADALLLLPSTNLAADGKASGKPVLIGVKELEYLASGTPVLSLGRLLPELNEVARGCPQLMEAESAAEGVAFLRDEAMALRGASGASSSRRAAVNLPSVRRHGWPAKVADLERVLEAVAAGR
jgi:glycosyltransferase involved in cell wall biosynthesis